MEWTDVCPGGPTVGVNQLGEIWWGLKEDEKATPYIRIVRCLPVKDTPMLESHADSQIKDMVEFTHGIDSTESAQYMPSIREEVKKYTLDPLILEENYDQMCPSRNDEKVHQFYISETFNVLSTVCYLY